jgi:hypothetical protein
MTTRHAFIGSRFARGSIDTLFVRVTPWCLRKPSGDILHERVAAVGSVNVGAPLTSLRIRNECPCEFRDLPDGLTCARGSTLSRMRSQSIVAQPIHQQNRRVRTGNEVNTNSSGKLA